MKALSIVRPGGRLIASGEKSLEVRRWKPNLKPSEDLLIVENNRFLYTEGDEDPDGIAVAIVRVKRIRPFTLDDMEAACANRFEDGWLAWELNEIRALTQNVPINAARRVYNVDFPHCCT